MSLESCLGAAPYPCAKARTDKVILRTAMFDLGVRGPHWTDCRRKYETAATLLRQRIVLVPRTDFSRALLASALGHLGEFEEARRVWRELKEINPNYAFAEHVGRQPFRREEDVERIADGLSKARLLNYQ